MAPKPYLQIEVDEHSADVGAITRCEAFVDSLKNVRKREHEAPHVRTRTGSSPSEAKERVIYIPHMGDVAYALRGAFRAYGHYAEVMPPSDERTLECGRRFTSGKECYPCIITTGDMVKIATSEGFERDRSIVTNALAHRGQAVVLRFDVVDFFPSTSVKRLRKYFRRIGWNRPAAKLLLRLCTHEG